ncbi:hypothetical protein WAK64_05290 [Bacillus spongiae]|uniref:YncE family protein n=1 Tax=Bacillus spongiae TaxID=2683610 RepID=A0ABU8HAY6_9BACI
MKKIVLMLLIYIMITGCQEQSYPTIKNDESFVASLNVRDSSLSFISDGAQSMATWNLNELYTGGILLNNNQDLLLFGYQLNHVSLFSLQRGELLEKWTIGEGITGAIEIGDEIALASSKTNEVIIVSKRGEITKRINVGLYPMDMKIYNGDLYVINYKDTSLSVIELTSKTVVREFEVPSSSTGLFIDENVIWVGGHGQGSKPRTDLRFYSSQNGAELGSVEVGTMPVNVVKDKEGYFVASHGSNEIYQLDRNKKVVNSRIIGANPFTLVTFSEWVVVAGYDSNELYFLNKDTLEPERTVGVEKGPFVLLSREKVME